MKEYAGFWLRFVAYIVDYIIIQIIQTFIIIPILGVMGFTFAAANGFDIDFEDMSDGEIFAAMATMVSALASMAILAAIIQILYYSLMESSKNKATLGKMVLGLEVTDMDGNRLSFTKSILRQLGKIISTLFFFIGYIIAGFTDKKQALHDMIAGTLVVKK